MWQGLGEPFLVQETNVTDLKRDYALLLDASGSMSIKDCDGKARWNAAEESTMALATKVEGLDPDGIDIYVFNRAIKTHKGVSADKVGQIFKESEPFGGTDTAGVLESLFSSWRANNKKPLTALIITDGQPDDTAKVEKAIINVTKEMDADEQLALSFLQIGKDTEAKAFLEYLDDDLVGKGAKFDIVDTKSFDAIEKSGMTMTEVLLAAIDD